MILNANKFLDFLYNELVEFKYSNNLNYNTASLIYFQNVDFLNFELDDFINKFKLELSNENIFTEEQLNDLMGIIKKDFLIKQDKIQDLLFYGKYPSSKYKCIDNYIEVKNPNEWLECPKCKLKPLIWIFDNGVSTACGCGLDKYNHFKIKAECINSKYFRGLDLLRSTEEELKENWNHWVETGEDNFEIKKKQLQEHEINIY